MFDARTRPSGLSQADLATLRAFGVEGALVLPPPPASLDDLERCLEEGARQRERLEREGFSAVACACVPLRFASGRGVGRALQALPRWLGRRGVAALGPLELTTGSVDERERFLEQATLATGLALPLLVTAPISRHEALTARSLALLAGAGVDPARVLIDGLRLKTVRAVLARGFHAGLTLHPDRLDVDLAERLVRGLGPRRLVLGSGAGEGPSELLAVPRLVSRLEEGGLSAGVIRRVSGQTPRAFFRLD